MKPDIHVIQTLPADAGELISPDFSRGDLAVVQTARVSFLGESKGAEADKKLLAYLWRHGHMSPFEQVVVQLRIHAPLIVWWQWVRYRHQSMNLQSGRYVEFNDEFYTPDVWRRQSASNKQGSEGELSPPDQIRMDNLYREVMRVTYSAYELALDHGMAKEQARLFLPGFAMYYTGQTTLNLRECLHIIQQRDHDHAQHEIREYARELKTQLEVLFPATMELFNHA